ncbi:MAG TPA: ATP-binding protein, partial [Acetobacteraceae bacterium]|nr:ATP-binding protein [Acetobacteraceae bacterium]
MSSDATDAVQSESIRTVYRQLPLTLGVSVLIAAITAWALQPRVGPTPVAVWLAAFVAMAVLRAAVWRGFMRASPERQRAPVWARAAVAGSLLSGLLWGVCCVFLMPWEPPYPLFVAFVVGGMSAGCITVNAAHLPSVAAFILPAVLPLAVRLLWHNGPLALAMAFMTLLFAGGLLLAAWRFAGEFSAAVRARHALAERTAELAAANARLRAEIIEREGAEAALRQAQKMEAIGSLTAGIAHDVNNVLTVVRGAADVLRRRLSHAPAHLRQVAAIQRATDRGAALTRRLLAFAREQELAPECLDVNAAVEGIAGLLAATLGKSVRVVLALDDSAPHAFIDCSGFEHAVINLAINARDAMPEGGTLTLGTSKVWLSANAAAVGVKAGSYTVVTVADTGTGMSEAVQARAFDPFFTTKPAGRGTGLGLSQVYGFLRQSGGAVRIESEPGHGTTFLLYLPQSGGAISAPAGPPQADAMAPAQDATHGRAMRHIVLLDDEDLVREVVAELLEGAGY